MMSRLRALVGLAVVAVFGAATAAESSVVVDTFEDVSAWSAHPAEGVTLALASDTGDRGRALRMDVRFTRGTGYAVARRAVSLDLPDDYVFRFRLRGDIPTNALEFKLVDSTGNNVWWHVRRDFEFPREWRTVSIRKRQIRFAWGPAGGGDLQHVAFIEIAVTAGEGGAGSVWLDELKLEPLAADSTLTKVKARASSGVASRAVDGKLTSWRSAAGDARPWLELDLGRPREFGGLDLQWRLGERLSAYDVAFSLDGATWTVADTIRGGVGFRDQLYLPESEARFVRLRAVDAVRASVGLSEVILKPLEWSATPEAYFTNLAKDAQRGTYPRPYTGEQCAWAAVGSDGGHEEALLSEDGMVEVGKRMFSIEPFLRVDMQLITWAHVKTSQTLAERYLPVPSTQWENRHGRLKITCQAWDRTDPRIRLIYEVTNPAPVLRGLPPTPRRITLYLAIRPFQVNPPWQNIGFTGGTARIHRIEREGPLIRVNRGRGIICDAPISAFGTLSRDDGGLIRAMSEGRVPAASEADNPAGFACGVLAFNMDLEPGQSKKVILRVPLGQLPDRFGSSAPEFMIPASVRAHLGPSEVSWEGPPLDRVQLMWADSAGHPIVARERPGREVLETVYAQIGWILVNRDGGAIQPGSRNYDRSWIRDGSLTSSALLRMGHPEVVRDFIEWFAPFQYENGKIPCCASDKGPDPVTENDSHGQFIWLIAEYYRYTGDRALVERMWPHVAAAVAHMDSLRGDRRTSEWRSPEKRKFFGLLLPSISHEGYPHPMHSYWDDFFGYRGYVDAAYLAGVLGRASDQRRFAAARDTFGRDLAASVAAAMKEKGIEYIPGCAEWGDFDATSTTVALTPTDAADLLPEAAVRATFERYWKFFTDRRDGKIEWDGFTPYEMRVIGSFVRLGWRDRANEALEWFMDYRNPPGWKQWAEVAYREKRAPKYIGDMPHTWVGSDFVRSVLDMLVYERGRDSSLVVGAGVPWSWIATEPGLRIRDVGTIYGRMAFTMRAQGDSVEVALEAGMRVPRGGMVVIPPARRPFRGARLNGQPAALTREGGVMVNALPARVLLSP